MPSSLVLGLVVGAFLFACEDTSTSSPSLDGGGVDITVPKDDAAVSDVPEAGTDALPDVFVPKTGVLIHVRRLSQPAANVRVLFHDAAGAVTSDLKTDAQGNVAAATAPSQVTVMFGEAQNNALHLVTYVAVAEGDELTIDDGLPDSEATVSSFGVTVPGARPNAIGYIASAGICSQGTDDPAAAIDLGLSAACLAQAGGTVAVLGWAEDEVSEPLAFAFKKGNANPAAGTTQALSLGAAWVDPTSVVVSGTNLPNGVTSAQFLMFGDGRPFQAGSGVGELSTGVTFKEAPGFAEAVQAAAIVSDDGPRTPTRTMMRRQASAAQLAFDFAQALPKITDLTVTDPTTARPTVAWTSEAPLTTSDGGMANFAWTTQLNPDQLTAHVWSFIVPPTATSVKAPELPADAAPQAPTGTVQGMFVGFGESDLLPSYAQWKSVPLNPTALDRLGTAGGALPANGSLRTTTWGVVPGG